MNTYRTGKLQSGEIDKIDDLAIDGLSGVDHSLAYMLEELERHFHSVERWFGSDGDNTASTTNNLTEFQLIAGTSEAFGTEVQLMAANDVSSSDFPITPVYFDLHRVLLTAASANDKNYLLQFWGGVSTFGAATLLSEIPYRKGATVSEVMPMPVQMDRVPVGYKVWGRVKSETDAATIDFLVGIHAYLG